MLAAAAAAAAAKSLQSCPTLCDPIDGSPLGSFVPGILQARILEWVAMPSSRGSSRSRDQTLRLMCAALAASLMSLALEKEMAAHSSILAWRIAGTEEPSGLLSMGSHRVGHD